MKRSETISELAKALVKFNSEISKISKDAENPFFKNNYATLDQIIDEVRPILHKNGLSVMQFPSGDGENISVTTYLLHESGEWMESDQLTLKPIKGDPQAAGSAITYARRYSLQAFLSLNTGEDDDGNAATHNKKPQHNEQGQKQNYSNNKNTNGPSEKQMKLLNTLIGKVSEAKGLTRDETIETLRKKKEIGTFESLTNLTVGQASKAIDTLNKALEG